MISNVEPVGDVVMNGPSSADLGRCGGANDELNGDGVVDGSKENGFNQNTVFSLSGVACVEPKGDIVFNE